RTPPTRRNIVRRPLSLIVAAAVLAALPAVPVAASSRASSPLWAEIRRTEYGIPHILAHNWTGLGFGTGYAFAQDNICTIARDYVTVDAQRSRFFGPDKSYLQQANGVRVTNLDSDLFFQQIIDSRVIN